MKLLCITGLRALAAFAFSAAVFAHSSPALSQPATPAAAPAPAPTAEDADKTAQAQTLFRSGRAALEAGELDAACTAFAESNRLVPRLSTLANLADCREQRGQLATALSLFSEVAAQLRGTADPGGKVLLEEAKARIARLSGRVSRIEIGLGVEPRPAGFEVLRGEVVLEPARLAEPQLLDGGSYEITARAPGYTPWRQTVTLRAEGDTQTVEIPSLVAESAAQSTSKLEVTASESPRRRTMVAPLALAGSALVLGAVAIVVDLSARGLQDDAEAAAARMDQSKALSLNDSANTRRHFAQGIGVAAGVCLGAAVYVYFASAKGSSATTTAARRVAPLLGDGVAGLQLGGSF